MSRFVSLAGKQVAELAERSAEAGRFSRGRALFRKGSVSDLSVIEGSAIASVRGSQGDEYETSVSTTPAPPGVIRQVAQANDPENPRSIDDLIDNGIDVCPREIDLAFACDCADWDEPCKHVVAVLLAFADRVDLNPAELLRWRGVELSGSVNQSGNRFGNPSGSQSGNRSPVGDPDARTAKLSELEGLLGDTVMQVPAADGSDPDRSAPALDPALANFLGVDMTLDPVDVSEIGSPRPLFADVQLGPLADLGPELDRAVATIKARLQHLSSR